jgi:hypothetical protein
MALFGLAFTFQDPVRQLQFGVDAAADANHRKDEADDGSDLAASKPTGDCYDLGN